MRKNSLLAVLVVLLIGLVLRLWNINFGLPHSWYADEPEIGEPAIKYTYQLRDIIKKNELYRLAPESYVYGTFPVYFYTSLLILFSKTLGILNVTFSKTDLYVFMRVINAFISLSLLPLFYVLLRNLPLRQNRLFSLHGLTLMALSWKLIVHAHYLNHDIIITFLILASNLMFFKYLNKEHDTKYTVLFSVFFGLAVATKITVLLTLPLYLVLFLIRHDIKNIIAALFIILGVYLITNPFSLVFLNQFLLRISEMRYKEAGMVFDSVNYSPFKYLSALSWMLTLPMFILSVAGISVSRKMFTDRSSRQFLVLMALQVLFYLIFFSVQSRRVDRWMLPILPNLLMFSVLALDWVFALLKSEWQKYTILAFFCMTFLYYLYFPATLLSQFQRNTPKSSAYIWARDNLPPTSTKFGITEEGLDPLNKLPFSNIMQMNVYELDRGYNVYPPDPSLYNYVFISSRPISWTQNTDVAKKYPVYSQKWSDFKSELNDTSKFQLVKFFMTANPNLVPFSEVYVYKNLQL